MGLKILSRLTLLKVQNVVFILQFGLVLVQLLAHHSHAEPINVFNWSWTEGHLS